MRIAHQLPERDARIASAGRDPVLSLIGVASFPAIGSTPITWPQEIESQTQLIHDIGLGAGI